MASLPGQVPEQISTSEQPRTQVSPAEVASPYELLGNVLDKTGHAFEDISVHLAEQAGYKAVTRDAAGNIQIEKAPIFGPAAAAYTRTATMGALAEASNASRRQDIALRQQFPADPDGYERAATAFRNTMVNKYTEAAGPALGEAVGRAIDDTTTATYRSIQNEHQRITTQKAEGDIKYSIASTEDDLVAKVRGGVPTDSPDVQRDLSTILSQRNELVKNPLIGYSQSQADYENQHFLGKLQANGFLHTVDQKYQDGPDAETRARNALDFAKTILSNPDIKLSEHERNAYYHEAISEIRANESERKQSIADLRSSLTEYQTAVSLGLDPDPQRTDQYYRGFQKLGATREAMAVLSWEARAPLVRLGGRVPLPDQVNTLRQLEGQALPSGFMDAIKRSEGFTPAAKWDVKQYTNGYGTRALAPGERITPDEAERRFNREIANAASVVDQVNPNLPPGVRAALTSLTFNAGADWTHSELGERIRAGDLQGAQERFLHYAQAGGQTNDALVERRRQEAQWFGGGAPSDPSGISPSVATAYQQNLARHVQGESMQAWNELWKEWREHGTRPSDGVLFSLADAARASGNDVLLDTMSKSVAIMDGVQQAAQGPLAGQEAQIAELRQRAAGGLAAPGDTEFRAELEKRYEQITKGLAEDAPATVAANFPDRFKAPAPLDLSNDQALLAGLAQRGQMAAFAAANWQTRTPSALGAGDLAAVQSVLDRGNVSDKTRIFGALVQAIPNEQVLNATLAKIGERDGGSMVTAFAASLIPEDRAAATSIMSGQDALKADKRFAPEGAEERLYQDRLDRMMPATTFSLAGRTSPNGPYATLTGAIRATYADLSARAGDTSGTLKPERLQQAVDGVTGGILTHNGRTLIAPTRGMSQLDFDRVIWGLTDADLAGATTLSGQPITARYLATQAKLESVGDGRYNVLLGNDAMRPIYAVQKSETGAPRTFILDLRNRTRSPAPVLGEPSTPGLY